jgi:proteic killer suppression protein
MDASFSTTKLQKLCASDRSLQRQLGTAGAKKAKSYLASIAAADTLAEFRHLPGHCHELEADRAGQLALNLPDGKRLVFEPTDDPPPSKPGGGLDWATVRSVRILEIGDYH